MNYIDLAAYLPKLGMMTSEIQSCGTAPSVLQQRSRRRKQKNKPGRTAVVMMKPPILTTHPNANKPSNWVCPHSAKSKSKKTIVRMKPTKIKKTINSSEGRQTTLVLKNENILEKDNQRFQVLEKAMEEFKAQRDQFISSLEGLQKRLIEFQIPDLFGIPARNVKDERSRGDALQNGVAKRPHSIATIKNVRSVSQHFNLADLTESESRSMSASSSELEEPERGSSSNPNADLTLIPIQPPKRNNPERAKFPTEKEWTVSKSPKSNLVVKLKRNLQQHKFNRKIYNEEQKATCNPPKSPGARFRQVSPEKNDTVAHEFQKLKQASEMRMRDKLMKL